MKYYMQLSKGLITKHKNIRQAELMQIGTLLECYGQFSNNEIDLYKLVYIGQGTRNDKHIIDKIQKYK